MLKVTDLTVHYGAIQALRGISFDVNQGEIITLIGSNGAGKTTTLKMITGILNPDKGDIFIDGVNITENPIEEVYAGFDILKALELRV